MEYLTRNGRKARGTTRKNRRGITLIEVLFATTTLVMGLMAACFLSGIGTSVGTNARNTSQAYEAAQQEIELLRNVPFTTLQNLTQPSATPEARFLKSDGTADASRPGDTGYPGVAKALAQLPSGTGGLIISDDPAAPNGYGNQVKHITVIVRWTDGADGKTLTNSIAVGTVIGQGGIGAR